MSHFRDRVIRNLPGENIPQLPSSQRAIANVPAIRTSVVLATVIVSLHSINNASVDLTSAVPVESTNATSP